jgi:hypothetical protein
MIKNNPHAITTIQNPTEEMKLTAIRKNGLLLEYITDPTRQMQKLALDNNPHAIQFIHDPTEEMMLQAIRGGWINLEYIKKPTDQVLRLALSQAGWAIKYIDSPSEELQLMAVRKDYDSIKFIKEPYGSVQEEAVRAHYEALRLIKAPTPQVILIAIHENEEAITFINDLDRERILEYMKVNFLVIKYMKKDIARADLEMVLKDVLSKEDVEEKYVRDFIIYNLVDRFDLKPMDKIRIIYEYGSKKAKRIAVDEKLKIK